MKLFSKRKKERICRNRCVPPMKKKKSVYITITETEIKRTETEIKSNAYEVNYDSR